MKAIKLATSPMQPGLDFRLDIHLSLAVINLAEIFDLELIRNNPLTGFIPFHQGCTAIPIK